MKSKMTNRTKSGRLVFVALITLFVITGGIAVYNLLKTDMEYTAADNEYEELRRFAPVLIDSAPGSGSAVDEPENPQTEPPEEAAALPEVMPDLSDINPDYIGWIRIENTNIDYPVVRGTNNEKYLNTTFKGERNPSGTIFMDYLCTEGFDGFAILHGHNMRNGSMFAGLHSFRDDNEQYSDIMIFKPDGELLIYRVFDVVITDNRDVVYSLPEMDSEAVDEFFAERGIYRSEGILVLSTCTEGPRDERLLVFAKR